MRRETSRSVQRRCGGSRPSYSQSEDSTETSVRLSARSPASQLDATTSVVDPRVQLVGYGPSASTIGANRAGRVAARNVSRWLEQEASLAS